MENTSRRITWTILSMSLLTVMAGAAIAPALDIIRAHFADQAPLLIQLLVSIPALFIIITNLFFLEISRHLKSKVIALIGLTLYVVAGVGCYFANDIWVLLLLRMLLGVSVGLVMPLSTGLLAYYYPPEEQSRLMGLSAAMNQMGGVVATLVAGLLATVQWNYCFLVYLLGLIAIILVVLYLPNEHLGSSNKRGVAFQPRQLLKFHPSVIGMFLLMMVFFIFPTNFAITAHERTNLSAEMITVIMVGFDVVAFFVGLLFGNVMRWFRRGVKYFASLFFLAAYAFFALGHSVPMLLMGCALGGIANGVGVPYLNTIASIKGGKNSATTVMPLLSAALYLGQFVSPIIVTPLSHSLFGTDATGCYKIGMIICLIFLWQTWSTRHFQSLPPEEK
jgi:MFS family permease